MGSDGEPPASHLEGPVSAARARALVGRVAEFDDAAGYGLVADGDVGRWFFHCTAIADGSRTIDVGAPVTFDVVGGRLGRWEADDLRPAPSLSP
jgi:cold shock CspA family protein